MATVSKTSRSKDRGTRRRGEIPVSLLSSVELFNVMVPEKPAEGDPADQQQRTPSVRPQHSTSLLRSIRLEVCREEEEPPPLSEELSEEDGAISCHQRSAVGRRCSVLYSRRSAAAIHPSWHNLHEQIPDDVDPTDGEKIDSTTLILKFYTCPVNEEGTKGTGEEPRPLPFLQMPLRDLVRIQLADKLRITDLLPVNAVLVQFATHSHPHSHEPYSHQGDDYSTPSLMSSSWYIPPTLYDSLIELTPSPLLTNTCPRTVPKTAWSATEANSSVDKKQVSQFFDDTMFDVLDSVADQGGDDLSTEVALDEPRTSDRAPDSILKDAETPAPPRWDGEELTAGGLTCDATVEPSTGHGGAPGLAAATHKRTLDTNRELRARIQLEQEALRRDLERLRRYEEGSRPSVSALQGQLETLHAETAQLADPSAEVMRQVSKLAFLLHAQRIRVVRELRSLYPIKPVSSAPASSPPRYSIRGLELPAVLVGSPSSLQSWNVAPNDEDAFSAAMGYLCHVVVRLSEYLGVPLRHRLYCQSSRSVVQDGPTGAFYPLFVAPRQPYHHPSPEREKLLAGWDRLQSNVDALVREVEGGVGVGAATYSSGTVSTAVPPTTHILEKVRRVYDAVTLGR